VNGHVSCWMLDKLIYRRIGDACAFIVADDRLVVCLLNV